MKSLNSKQIDFLFQLLQTNSPSGFEQQIVSILQDNMSHYCKTYTESIGNFYMHLNNNSTCGLKVMLTAHCDEVGLQVVYIDKSGYVYARNVASIDKQTLPGSKVTAITDNGEITGVIGKKSPHILSAKDKDVVPNICDLWIDFGFETIAEAKSYIKVGDYLTLQSNPEVLCNGKRIISKALDNKISVFVLSEVIKN